MERVELIGDAIVDLHEARIERREPRHERRHRLRILAVILAEDRARPLAEELRQRVEAQLRHRVAFGRVSAHRRLRVLEQRLEIRQHDAALPGREIRPYQQIRFIKNRLDDVERLGSSSAHEITARCDGLDRSIERVVARAAFKDLTIQLWI